MITFEEFPDPNEGGLVRLENPFQLIKQDMRAIAWMPKINELYDVAEGFNEIFQREYLDGFNPENSDYHIFQAVRGRNTGRLLLTNVYERCFRALLIKIIEDHPENYEVRVQWTEIPGVLYYGADGYIWHDLKYLDLRKKGRYFGDRIKEINERISGIFSGIRVVDFTVCNDKQIKVHRPDKDDYVLITVKKHTISFKIGKHPAGYNKKAPEHLFYKDFYKKLVRMMHPEVKALNFLKIK